MRPNNERFRTIPLAVRLRTCGFGAATQLRGRATLCALAAVFFMLSVCVPSANAQEQVETAYAAIRPSLVFVVNYHGKHAYAIGTGFVVGHRDGHMLIVTNRHVIQDGSSFRGVIQYPTQVAFELTVIKVGESDDLALLESSEFDAPALSLATTLPALGHAVAIAGYPHTQIAIAGAGGGLTPSVHAGNVNALPGDGYYIQYDAQTDHGNSGGPLFDTSGLVYGVVVFKGGTAETNFAIAAVRLRTFLANAGVFPPSSPPVALAPGPGGSPAIASVPSPAAVLPAAIDAAACYTAVLEFAKIGNENLDRFNGYTTAMNAGAQALYDAQDQPALVDAMGRSSTALSTIQAIVRDEGKLSGFHERVVASGAAATAAALQTIITDTATRDQDALQVSIEVNYVVSVLLKGEPVDRTAVNPKVAELNRMKNRVVLDYHYVRDMGACTR